MAAPHPRTVVHGLRSAHELAEGIRQRVHAATVAQTHGSSKVADEQTQAAYDAVDQLYDVLEGTLSLLDEQRRQRFNAAAVDQADGFAGAHA